MATVKITYGTISAVTVTGFATLASATYAVSATITPTTTVALDQVVEVSAATTNTPAGNKQVLVFAQASYDGGTTWQSGPTSGTTATDEPDLTFLGALPVNSATATHTKAFTVAASYGGILPPLLRIVVKNDLGVALTAGTLRSGSIIGDVS